MHSRERRNTSHYYESDTTKTSPTDVEIYKSPAYSLALALEYLTYFTHGKRASAYYGHGPRLSISYTTDNRERQRDGELLNKRIIEKYYVDLGWTGNVGVQRSLKDNLYLIFQYSGGLHIRHTAKNYIDKFILNNQIRSKSVQTDKEYSVDTTSGIFFGLSVYF